MKKKQLELLKHNLNNNVEFYAFNQVNKDDNHNIYYNGSPVQKHGICIMGDGGPFSHESYFDIAYKKDDKFYQLLTNNEVVIISETYDSIDENTIIAAKSIHRASQYEVEAYVNYICRKSNAKAYLNSEKQRIKKIRKIK